MTIYCIEQNYLATAGTRRAADELIIFVKDEQSLLPAGEPMTFAHFADQHLYCQAELAIRVRSDGHRIPVDDAGGYVDAVTTGINFIAIDILDELNDLEVPWQQIKGWKNSSAVGEWFPANSLPNLRDIQFCLYKNREMVQMADSSQMLAGLHEIVAAVSNEYALKAGDIIFTGSPGGGAQLFAGDNLESFLDDDSALEIGIVEG